MAKKVQLVDDVDEESDADRTLLFAFAGKEYEIDLCEDNAQQMEDEIGFWIDHARKRGTVPKLLAARKATKTQTHDDDADDGDDEWWRTPIDASPAEAERYHKMRQEIREWGIDNGFPSLGDRGKLPRALYAKWRKAHQTQHRHRKQDVEDDDTDPTETETDAGQDELALTPRFSAGKPRKAPAKKAGSRSASPVRVAS